MNSIANGTNTISVISSCRILSWPSDITVKPIRFAGTCSRYSNSAMPHEINAAIHHGRSSSVRRWPYQANVMNRFEHDRSTAQTSAGWVAREAGFIGNARDGALAPAALSPTVTGTLLAERSDFHAFRPGRPLGRHVRR